MRPTTLQSERSCNVLKSHGVGITMDKQHRALTSQIPKNTGNIETRADVVELASADF
jgi:hypothetical protein